MKIRTRSIALASVLSLSCALAGPLSWADDEATDPPAPAPTASEIVTLNLYNLTDVHGHIEKVIDKKKGKVKEAGLAAVGCYLDKARASGEEASFTLLGDNIGASPYLSGSLEDNPTIAALNELSPLASTIGNHELDLGVQKFKDRIDGVGGMTKVGFPYLGANIDGMGNYLGSHKIWTSPSGVKVAFIGAIAQDVPYKLHPGATAGLTFNDPISKINTLAKQLKEAKEANIVIAMLDDDVKNNYPKMGAYVDGIMGGDTHVPYSFSMVKGAEGTTLSGIASGSYTDNLANLRFSYNTKTGKVVSSEAILIPADEIAKCGEKTEITSIITDAKAKAEEAGKSVVASGIFDSFGRGVFTDPNTDGEATTPGSNRGIESSLGDLVADSLRETITTTNGTPVDIGMINAGGLRADLTPNADGTITYKQTYDVAPFSNELGYVTITGAKVKEALEQQWKTDLNSQNSRPMLKLGLSKNVRYTYDPSLPYGERITSVMINDKPLDPQRMYTVGSVTFLLAGGDSFDALTSGGPYTNLGGLDRDGFNTYLKKNPGVKPRMAKSSIGISVPKNVFAPGDSATVKLRGLSFSEGSAITSKVRVKVGSAVASAAVNNDLTDMNANNEKAIITTDGAGQAEVTVPLGNQCTNADAGKEIILPVSVSTDFAEVVTASQGLSVKLSCPMLAPSPSEGTTATMPHSDEMTQTTGAAASHRVTKSGKKMLAHTGADASVLLLAAGLFAAVGAGALVVRRHEARKTC